MKTEKQQASELEVVHNSAMSENNTEETSQIDELESASTQELVISAPETAQNPPIPIETDVVHNSAMSAHNTEENSQIDELESASTQELVTSASETAQNSPIPIETDKETDAVKNTDSIGGFRKFIKTISPYLWAIVIVVVIIPLIGRGVIASSYNTVNNQDSGKVVVEWNKVDESIVEAIRNADTTAQRFAEAKLDDWVNGLMVNVDGSFLDWYFNYFNQKKLEFSSPIIWASSAVAHFVDSDQPSPEQVVAEKMTENFQLEFAKRVLRPKIAQFTIENITRDTVSMYVSQLEQNISNVQSSYNIPQGDWNRYLNEIAVTVNDSQGVVSTLSLKVLVGGGSYLFLKAAIPVGVKVGSQITAKFATKAATKIAAKSGGAVAAKIGAEFLDPIVGVGILIWDLWDYNHTVSVNRPILRASILEYLHQVKDSLVKDPINGIMGSIHELQYGILNSVQLAKHPG